MHGRHVVLSLVQVAGVQDVSGEANPLRLRHREFLVFLLPLVNIFSFCITKAWVAVLPVKKKKKK